MNVYKTIDVNKEENGGFFYAGTAKEVVLLLGTDDYEWKNAYIKGDKSLFINDERFVPSMTAWYCERNDVFEVTPIPDNSGIIRLPKDVFYKYFTVPKRNES